MHLVNHIFYTHTKLEEEILNFPSSKTIMIQLFCADFNTKIIQKILLHLQESLPDAVLIGASSAGGINNGKLCNDRILISFCFFEHTRVKAYYYPKANYSQGLKAAKNIIKRDTKVCIIFSETFKNDSEGFLDAFTKNNKSLVIAGGCASGEDHGKENFIIKDNTIYKEGIVLLSLNSTELNVYSDYSLTWSTVGKEMLVSRCENNIIYELDNKPIQEVYSHYLGKQIAAQLPNFDYEFPLIKTEKTMNVALSIREKTQDNAYLFSGKIQEGDRVKFSVTHETDSLNDTYKHQERILQNPIEVLFVYSCSARKHFIYDETHNEFTILNKVGKNSGFFTYGEFFNNNGKTYLLNNTSTTLSLSENNINKKIETNKEQEVLSKKISAQTHLIDTIQEELTSSQDLLNQYKIALDESAIVSKTDAQGQIIYVNDKFCQTSGYTREELMGQNHNIIRHPDTPTSLFVNMWNALIKGKVWQNTFKNKNKKGEEYYVKAVMIPIFDKKGKIIEYISIRTDVSEIFLKDKIIKEGLIDKLTQVNNREALLKLFEKKEKKYLLILINLDRFSEINNYFGYNIGDNVLKLFTKNLKEIFGNNIFRITGDEFAIVSKRPKEWESLLKSINFKILELENLHYKIAKYDISINTTSGMAFAKGKNIYTLAHIALKEAKEQRKKIVFFNAETSLKEKIRNNIIMIEKIKQAITEDRIVPYYQAIVDNKTKKVSKYEALIRLIDRDGKVLSPYLFLEHAKKAKLYGELTKIMIEKTFKKFKDLDFEFSINLTIQDILSYTTRKYLYDKLEEYKCGSRLILEIVESEGIENFEDIISFINKVKRYGCKVAIDDFGSGYSNFSYLAKLKVDFIKIDGSLIKNIHKDENQKNIVESILLFTKKQGLKTVAEFVENEEIFNVLKELDLDYSQGYYFSKPQKDL